MPGVDWQIHTVIPVGFANPTGADEGCLSEGVEQRIHPYIREG
jgi:hypothetical protein